MPYWSTMVNLITYELLTMVAKATILTIWLTMVNFAIMPLETIWMISWTGADFWFQVGVGWVNWVVSPLGVVWGTASSPDIFFAFYPKIVWFEAFSQSLIISNCFLALQALHYTWLHHVKPKSRAKPHSHTPAWWLQASAAPIHRESAPIISPSTTPSY